MLQVRLSAAVLVSVKFTSCAGSHLAAVVMCDVTHLRCDVFTLTIPIDEFAVCACRKYECEEHRPCRDGYFCKDHKCYK